MYPISGVAPPQPIKSAGALRRALKDPTRDDETTEDADPRAQARPPAGVGVLVDRSV